MAAVTGSGAAGGGVRVVPELAVSSIAAATAALAAQFGFVAQGNRLTRGDQVLLLVERQGRLAHGMIDHVALKAVDTDAASAAAERRGAVIDREVTPDGPVDIAAFWENGVRYQFFAGPGGARLELCARRGVALPLTAPLDQALLGHDHVGMICRDIDASVHFYQGLQFHLAFACDLATADGALPVRFMARDGQVLELYSPPARRTGALLVPAQGHWLGLRLEGAGRSAELQGPDGESLVLS